jgi:hypothetical protein
VENANDLNKVALSLQEILINYQYIRQYILIFLYLQLDLQKLDMLYINIDEGLAVIAQGYFAKDPTKQEAPANKASDLNTAAGWLLNRNIEELPEQIKSAAIQFRSALNNGQIKTIQFWYVHNLPESQNVREELKTVKNNAHSSLKQLLETEQLISDININVSAIEVGRNQIEKWYRLLSNLILVEADFCIDILGGYSIDGDDWSAFVTAIPATWLYDQFTCFKEDLFSANIRGYLGSRKSDSNINNGIKMTAENEPKHFWAYNNGLTILTYDFNFDESDKKLSITGISIVNGAQTTGAIGSLQDAPSSTAMVPARFIKCTNKNVIDNIIQFNNSQNQVEAPDFRSKDKIQQRLRKEFQSIPSVTYLGGRRGGSEDRIKRPANLLPSDTAGQALAAFHGDVLIAYNEKSKIWVLDNYYAKYFSDRTTAKHIMFVYSLLRAVQDRKQELMNLSNNQDLTEKQEKSLEFFRNRGSTFLLVSAISCSLEIIIEKPIHDKFLLTFKENISLQDCLTEWKPIVNSVSSFSEKLVQGLQNGLNNPDRVKTAISDFTSMIESFVALNEGTSNTYSNFANRIISQTSTTN